MRSKISILTMSIFMLLSSMAVLPIYAGDATVTDCTNFTGAGTISQAVIDANNGGGAISITCTGTIIFDNQLTIRADVILNNDSGGEVIFDETGDDNGFFFVRAGASFTLDGFTLQNGNSSLGGAIYTEFDSTLTINNSMFTNNSADGGGAIFNSDNTTLTINSSTFTGNSADDGGAIYNYNNGTLTIIDSTFTGNNALISGGAIYSIGTLTITNSMFTGNSADAGGAIYNGFGTVSSQDTHYENNTCAGDITDNGGNTATNARGCPSDTPVTDDTGDATISTCDFVTLQSAVSIANSGGGTISITCTGTIIFEDDLFIADNVIIQNNSGGEVIFDEMGDDNGFFDVGGGASFTLNGFTLQNGNNKTGLSAGGAIYNRGTLTIYNSTFISNSATISGGAIENRGTLTISDSTFIGNSTIFSSGAISNSGTLTITNSTFTDNSASDNSGAISNSGRLTITDSTFTGNSTTRVGGAIRNSGTLTITNSTFTDNSASYGGAIFNDDYSTASSQDTHYENNTCSGDITDNGGNTVTDAPDCPGN